MLAKILADLAVQLDQMETGQLHQELLAYFGLIGASDDCAALDAAWSDSYNRSRIEEFIRAWLRRKQRKQIITGLI